MTLGVSALFHPRYLKFRAETYGKIAMNRPSATASQRQEFSLVVGGPLYQALLRAHLLAPPMALVSRRIFAFLLITWVPLALLSALEGTFYAGVAVPFISDLGNIRFLITLPMLIGAELIVHPRIGLLVRQFEKRQLIAPEEAGQFESIIGNAMRLRNSVIVEVALFLLACVGGYWIWRSFGSVHVDTWYANSIHGYPALSYAGYWLTFISMPIFQFVLLRWYFRIFLWYLFLWRVSRLHLRLSPLHPDRAGGLGFLGNSIESLAPILLAQAILIAAQVGNQIIHEGAKLPDFQFLIGGFVAFLILVVVFPLTFFVFRLLQTKLNVAPQFGVLACHYVRGFQEKWMAPEAANEPLLGSSDIQSLADLGNSYEVVRTMRFVPFTLQSIIRLTIVLVIPMLPLALTMFSFKEIAMQIFKMLF